MDDEINVSSAQGNAEPQTVTEAPRPSPSVAAPETAETDDAGVKAKKRKKKRKMRVPRFLRKLIINIALIAAVAAAAALFWPQISDLLGISNNYTLEIQTAILGESRDKTELVVMEQDAAVTTEISSSLFNWEIFKKTKKIYSYGMGIFTVDLSVLTSEDVAVDPDAQTVAVTVPSAALKYVNVDLTKTQFEETERGLLAFGEIKLTVEQQALLDETITLSMRSKLDTAECIEKANGYAVENITAMFEPLVAAISDSYPVVVKIKTAE